MKEIELLKTIFKDSPDILEPLNEIEKEIKSHIEFNKYLQKEIVKANNIIKEAREELKKYENDGEANRYAPITECLEILDKENKNEPKY